MFLYLKFVKHVYKRLPYTDKQAVEHLYGDSVIVSGSHTYRHGTAINQDFV